MVTGNSSLLLFGAELAAREALEDLKLLIAAIAIFAAYRPAILAAVNSAAAIPAIAAFSWAESHF